MGCGTSRSNLRDEGLGVLRSPHHSKPEDDPHKLLIRDTSETFILDQPPALQKINAAHDGNVEPLWVGSPSFREYVQSVPNDDDVPTSGYGRGKEIVISTQGGKKLICNGEVCVLRDFEGKEQADKSDTRGGRFRKVFKVHRVTFWHGRAWYPGHPKATA
ncbi:hypothetical protein L1887_10098 [Cichorium endivia]|nr:hypothetical protein L1887_10098 [Cichorium endivia]